MTAFSRREFGRMVVAGVPLVAVAGSREPPRRLRSLSA